MVKNNPQEQKLKKVNSTLWNMAYNKDTDKIRIYLKSLLTKCLEALAENDYNKYNLAESVLNEAIVRVGSSIDNFEEFYSNLKHEVAIEFLKKMLDVDSIPILNNNPVEAVLITSKKAEEIKNIWDYIHYSVTKKEIYNYWKREENYKTYENEAYTVLLNLFFIVIIDKSKANGTYLDTHFNFKLGLESEIDVLEGFVTKNPELITPLTIAERLVLAEQEVDFTADNNYNFINWSLEEDTILYYNENKDFLVLINDSAYFILNKRTGKSINFYLQHGQKDIFKTVEFLAKFSDYCLGTEGILKEKEIEEKAPEEVLFQGIKKLGVEDG